MIARALCCSHSRRHAAVSVLLALAALVAPATVFGQATTTTTVNVTGGSQPSGQTVPTGQVQFGLQVPLRPNAENVLTLTGTDGSGQTATVNDLRIAQISLTEIVQARVTATRLSTPEVRQLVAQGVIDIADPANYNVSRFVVILTVGGQQVEVPVPVVRRIDETFAEGPPVTVGCAAPGQGLSTTDRSISIPCGGGGGRAQDMPPIRFVPFEVASPSPGLPSVPGVIIIEGRIKTLKEFFKVSLLLMNVSSLFTLTDLTARLEVPTDALTPVAPAGGALVLPELAPGTDATGDFIVRGDTRGVHTVTAHFGGKIAGAFLPAPVAFSGSASTDLEVKGPPKLDVRVSHPDFVQAGVPYDLTVTIENTDEELDALYASMEIDVGAGADLLDETTGQLIDGPVGRSLGDILRGQSIVQTYKVMPLISGAIIACVGAADANINLSVAFVGNGPGCAIGTLPGARLNPDGKPTVTVVPAHNTVGVNPATAIVALFSDQMLTPTITAGFSGAAFTVIDASGTLVDGTLSFAEIFGGTAAIFQPGARLRSDTIYTITVNPSVFNTQGLSLASGIVARFTTSAAAPLLDTTPPVVTLAVEPPLTPTAISRGQSVPIAATASDAQGIARVDLLVDGALVDTKRGSASLRFLIETAGMLDGSTHAVEVRAYDLAGNTGTAILALQIAPDSQPPVAAIVADQAVVQGRVLSAVVQASDDGRVARVELFLDGGITPIGTRLVEPFQFDVRTTGLSAGAHQLRAVVEDGAANVTQSTATFQVTTDGVPPQLGLVIPQGTRFRGGAPIAFAVQAVDDVAVASISYRLDGELLPRGSGDSFMLSTTDLALGPHVMAVVALDTSGNSAALSVPFELTAPSTSTTPPAPVALAAVTLTPTSASLVTIAGAAGAAEPGARILLTNQTTQFATTAVASGAGVFSAVVEAAGGEVIVLVAIDEAGNPSTPVSIAVPVPAALLSIAVAPTSVSLSRSQTSAQLGVLGTFSDNTQQFLTTGLAFTSSAPGVASATASGLVLPGVNGSAIITVASASPGVAAVSVPVTVDFTAVVGISASPSPLILQGLGQSSRLTVSAVFSDSTAGAFNGSPRFATTNPSVAIVDGTGLVTSTGIGSTSITIAATGLPTIQVLVTVNAVQATDLVVTPSSAAFTALGQVQPLAVQYRYSDGTVGAGAFAVSFQSLDQAVASVNAGGVVMATGEGTTSIVVQSQGFIASVPVSVTLPISLPPPVITSLGRPIAGEGDSLAILGQNFSGTPANNFATINGLRATVLSASAERLIVEVPRGATTGNVQVRVAGQSSNTVTVDVYARRARTILDSAPFEAGAGANQNIALGNATFYLQPGDEVVVSGDPNTINGPSWSGLVAPVVNGTLILSVNGSDVVLTPNGQPINVTSYLPVVSQPTMVTVSLRIDSPGGNASSRGLAIVAGPAGDRGVRGTTGHDRRPHRRSTDRCASAPTRPTALALPPPPSTGIDWTARCCNNSAGGALVGGTATPNDGSFRTFTATGGEVVVTYSDAPVLADFGAPRVAVRCAGARQRERQPSRDHAGRRSQDRDRCARFGQHPAAANVGDCRRRPARRRRRHQQRARQFRQPGNRRRPSCRDCRQLVSTKRWRMLQRIGWRCPHRRCLHPQRRQLPHGDPRVWCGANCLLGRREYPVVRVDRHGGPGRDRGRWRQLASNHASTC